MGDSSISKLHFLLGTWVGKGAGKFPTIQSFAYKETLSFSVDDFNDLIHYEQRTWLLPDNIPTHWESGFIRPVEHTDNTSEISNAQDSGRVEVLTVNYTNTNEVHKLHCHIKLIENDPRMVRSERVFTIRGNQLSYVINMATRLTPIHQQHLEAVLEKASISDAVINIEDTLHQSLLRDIALPASTEYNSISERYINLVRTDMPVLKQLQENGKAIIQLYRSLSPEQLEYRYANNKWTLKEILVHLIDEERIYAYRALRFARCDPKQLAGFDQDLLIRFAEVKERPIASIISEYGALRFSTILMYNSFTEAALNRTGSTDECKISVRSLLYHMAGHEIYHFQVIDDKYVNDKVLRQKEQLGMNLEHKN